MKLFKAIGLGFAGLGLVLLVTSVLIYRNTQGFIEHSQVATGTVIKLTSEWTDGGARVYYPVVAFTTASGEAVEFRSNIGSSTPSYELGARLSVRYEPARPSSAGINSPLTLWFGFGVVFSLGLAFLAMGSGALYMAVRHPERVRLRVNNRRQAVVTG